jgi:integrase
MHCLQRLTTLHVERYYRESKLSQRTLAMHRAVLTMALNAAMANGYLRNNVATRATNKPRARASEDVLNNVWTADEARQFLVSVKHTKNAQNAALFAVALDGGLRKGELLGLQWQDVDLTTGSLKVERQLLGRNDDKGLITSLPKGNRARSLDLSGETLALLREHKCEQAELKMKNRPHYTDHGLMFAQTWEHQSSKHSVLGSPLHKMAIGMQLDRLCNAAGVRRISVHGLRHTCATLLLAADVPANVVQRRLGHKTSASRLTSTHTS